MSGQQNSVLDTNYLIRLLVRDVPAQTDVVARLVKQAEPRTLIVSDVIFAEAVFVLEKFYEFDRQVIVKLLEFVLDHTVFEVNTKLLGRALERYAAHSRLSFVDCYAWSQAEQQSEQLRTFDQDLEKAASSRH